MVQSGIRAEFDTDLFTADGKASVLHPGGGKADGVRKQKPAQLTPLLRRDACRARCNSGL